MDTWYYASNGAQVGPVTKSELTHLLSTSQIAADILVWCVGMPEWVAANTLAELTVPPIATPAPVIGYGVGESMYTRPEIGLRFAGFWIRLVAAFIDWIALILVTTVVGVFQAIMINMLGSRAIEMFRPTERVAMFVIPWLYSSLMQSSSLQATFGMMAVGLRVTDLAGRRLGFGRASGRFFASILSAWLLMIGFFMIGWTRRKQGLHDLIASTLVLWK